MSQNTLNAIAITVGDGEVPYYFLRATVCMNQLERLSLNLRLPGVARVEQMHV